MISKTCERIRLLVVVLDRSLGGVAKAITTNDDDNERQRTAMKLRYEPLWQATAAATVQKHTRHMSFLFQD